MKTGMIVENHLQKLAEAALRFHAARRIDDTALRQSRFA